MNLNPSVVLVRKEGKTVVFIDTGDQGMKFRLLFAVFVVCPLKHLVCFGEGQGKKG